jgi:hypothetical protein
MLLDFELQKTLPPEQSGAMSGIRACYGKRHTC